MVFCLFCCNEFLVFLIISSVKVEGGRVVIKEEFFFVVFRRV